MADNDKIIRARKGDTLCTIAIRDGGFLNCDPLRDEAANSDKLIATLSRGMSVLVPALPKNYDTGSTDQKHEFTKKNALPPDIRFVHGSPGLPYRQDRTVHHLNISNYPSDKGGRYPTGSGGPNNYSALPAFPSGFGYHDDGHHDEDTFKIEVVDPQEGADIIKVKLKALMPVYTDRKVTGHTDFAAAAPNAANREVEVDCERVKAGLKVFRSRYMRLVTDVQDFISINANKQALLVAPMADGNAGAADEVEVLDQRVRVEYEPKICKASKGDKCKLVAELPVSRTGRRRRVKAAVHILRTSRGGSGVVTIQQARQSLLNFVREVFSQAELSLKLVDDTIRLVNPPANMITISNNHGRRAAGDGTISVRVRVDGDDNTISITTRANHTPTQTAIRLAREIRKICKVKAVATRNPPTTGRAIGSADVLVGDPNAQNVRVSVTSSTDTRQDAQRTRITGTQITEFDTIDSHVGTMDERILVKNYGTGRYHIDTFVVGTLHQGSFGEAFSPNRSSSVNERPRSLMINSVIIKAQTQQSRSHAHTTIPHEWAHVLQDAGHITNPSTELSFNGAPVGDNEQVVDGPKRIGDPPNSHVLRVEWSDNVKGNPVKRLRSKNTSLLTGW